MPVREAVAKGQSLTQPRRGTRQRPNPPKAVPQESGTVFDKDTLSSFFTLTPEDLSLVRTARSPRNQLGLALLIAWTQAERRAVSDPSKLPTGPGTPERVPSGKVEGAVSYAGKRPMTWS